MVTITKTMIITIISISVSNGSGLPGFGPGWNRTEGPGPGQEPPSNPTRFVLAGCYPDRA